MTGQIFRSQTSRSLQKAVECVERYFEHLYTCPGSRLYPRIYPPLAFIADYLLDHAPVPDYVKAMDSFDEKKVGAQMDALHEGAREVLANKVE